MNCNKLCCIIQHDGRLLLSIGDKSTRTSVTPPKKKPRSWETQKPSLLGQYRIQFCLRSPPHLYLAPRRLRLALWRANFLQVSSKLAIPPRGALSWFYGRSTFPKEKIDLYNVHFKPWGYRPVRYRLGFVHVCWVVRDEVRMKTRKYGGRF